MVFFPPKILIRFESKTQVKEQEMMKNQVTLTGQLTFKSQHTMQVNLLLASTKIQVK